MSEPTPTTCPTCGQRVEIASGDEGTQGYVGFPLTGGGTTAKRRPEPSDAHAYDHDGGLSACRACGGQRDWPVHDALYRASPAVMALAAAVKPILRSGWFALGRFEENDDDAAAAEYILAALSADPAGARAVAAELLPVEVLSNATTDHYTSSG